MKAILAIARAEFLKNWKIIAVPLAAVVGVFVLAALGTKVSDRDFRGSLMGMFVLFTFPLAAVPAAVLGLNLFGPDIRQRRLSFFLTRPCAPWQLWLGRLTGAFAIVGIGWLGVLATIPFSGFNGGVVGGIESLSVAAALAGGLLVMNAIAMILAANSARWFIADLMATIAFFAGVAWSANRTLALGDLALLQDGLYALIVGAFVALFFGGMAFLWAGHGEGSSGHRAHSLTLWAFGAMTFAGLGAQRAYEWNRPLSSFVSYPSAKSVGPGEALFSAWRRRGLTFQFLTDWSNWTLRSACFLLDTRTGQAHRVNGFMCWGSAANAKSGLVGFVEPRLDANRLTGLHAYHLVISSFDSSRPPVADTPIPSRFHQLMDISPSGELATFLTSNSLVVIRTQTGETVFESPATKMRWARFQNESTIAALDADGAAARLRFLGLEGKLIEERRFQVSDETWFVTLHSDSGRVAITPARTGVALFERDGRMVASLPPSPQRGANFRGTDSASPQAVLMTHTGDLLFVGGQGLRVVRHGESVVREVPVLLENSATTLRGALTISGELESGDILVSQFERGESSIFLVDPLTGAIRLRLKQFRPLVFRKLWDIVGASDPSEDSALRLFRNEDRDIVYLDPGATTPRLLVKNTSEDR